MKYKFVTMVEGAHPHRAMVCDTFEEAWRDMCVWVKDQFKLEEMSFQVLETAIWIECTNTGTGLATPLYFYDARNRAYAEGIVDKIKAEEEVTK